MRLADFLEPADRDALLGDLAESDAGRWEALRETALLVARRGWALLNERPGLTILIAWNLAKLSLRPHDYFPSLHWPLRRDGLIDAAELTGLLLLIAGFNIWRGVRMKHREGMVGERHASAVAVGETVLAVVFVLVPTFNGRNAHGLLHALAVVTLVLVLSVLVTCVPLLAAVRYARHCPAEREDGLLILDLRGSHEAR